MTVLPLLEPLWRRIGVVAPSYTERAFDVCTFHDNGRRGCVARRDIERGEKLLIVPFAAVLAEDATDPTTELALSKRLYNILRQDASGGDGGGDGGDGGGEDDGFHFDEEGAAVWQEYTAAVLPPEGTGAFAFASAEEIAQLQLPSAISRATLTKERMDVARAKFVKGARRKKVRPCASELPLYGCGACS